MGYSERVYKEAYKILEERRLKSISDHAERVAEVLTKIPAFNKIQSDILALIGQITKVCLESGDIKAEAKKLKRLYQKRNDILVDNHYNKDYIEITYFCEKCNDTGFIVNKKCECLELLLKQTAYALSNIDNLLDKKSFDDFSLTMYSEKKDEKFGLSPRENMKKVLKLCHHFVDNFDEVKNSLLFIGDTGLGKTFLSSCIAKELLANSKNVFYQTASKITEILEANKFGKLKDADEFVLSELFDCDLLIIDDLGAEFSTALYAVFIYDVISTRLLKGKKMIINTNLAFDNIDALYSPRVTSRILGEFITVKFFGDDIRIKKMLNL